MCEKVKLSPVKMCNRCNSNVEKTLIHSEGIYVCQECGGFEYVIIESEVPSELEKRLSQGISPLTPSRLSETEFDREF